MKAPVNKIISFSAVDGPGNRTAIFLQGCNLDCRYCHNPETRNLCVGCMDCVNRCPTGALKEEKGKVVYDPGRCVFCDTCIQVCSHGSSPRIMELTPEETWKEIEKQIPFIRGITVSGGECTLYPEYLEELFTIAKEHGLTTMLDSNGTIDFRNYPKLLSVTDGVMLDIKAFSEEDHRKVTGSSNRQILENAAYLAEIGKLYEIRTVAVPGLFSVEETVKKAAAIIGPYGNIRYKLIAYRPMGVRKEYADYPVPDPAYLDVLAELARQEGVQEIVII